MQLRRSRLHSSPRVRHDGKGLVFNLHQLQSVFCDVPIFGDNDGNGIANVADFGRCDRRLLRAFQAGNNAGAHGDRFQARHVCGREHAYHSRQFKSSIRVYFQDARVRMSAAQDRSVNHTRSMNVAHVFADAAE